MGFVLNLRTVLPPFTPDKENGDKALAAAHV
jgi:hypothetical protein